MNILVAALCLTASSDGAAGEIELRVKENHSLLSWTNTNGLEFQLLRSAQVSGAWDAIVSLTGDGREIRWLDESKPVGQSFFRWKVKDPGARVHKLQSALNRARSAASVPGAAAAVITTNGIWVGTSGISDRKAATQIEPQMRFGIGSLSKSFVAATILQLEDEGALSIDDPLKKWVTDFPHVTNTITLRQLLNHTSGVYDLTDSWDWYNDTIGNPGQQFTVEELWKYIQEPYFTPGTAFHYSNTGYILLGLVIEAVTGRKVTEEYRRRFVEPLALTSIYMEGAEARSGEVVHSYSDFNPKGTVLDITEIPRTAYCSQYWTAAAVFADVFDTARWVHALWSGHLFSDKAVKEMLEWDPVTGSERYGLAVWSLQTARGQFFVHSGHIPGFRAYAGYSPGLKATVVLFFNNENAIESSWLTMVNAL